MSIFRANWNYFVFSREDIFVHGVFTVSLSLLIVRFKELESMCCLCRLSVEAGQNPQLYNRQ